MSLNLSNDNITPPPPNPNELDAEFNKWARFIEEPESLHHVTKQSSDFAEQLKKALIPLAEEAVTEKTPDGWSRTHWVRQAGDISDRAQVLVCDNWRLIENNLEFGYFTTGNHLYILLYMEWNDEKYIINWDYRDLSKVDSEEITLWFLDDGAMLKDLFGPPLKRKTKKTLESGQMLPLGCHKQEKWGYRITNFPALATGKNTGTGDDYFFGGGCWISLVDDPPPREFIAVGIGNGKPPFSLIKKQRKDSEN